jgi:hypothetical protein
MRLRSLLLLAFAVRSQESVIDGWEHLEVRDGVELETIRHPARRLAESPFEVAVFTVSAKTPGIIWRHTNSKTRRLQERVYDGVELDFSSERSTILASIYLLHALYPEREFEPFPEAYKSLYMTPAAKQTTDFDSTGEAGYLASINVSLTNDHANDAGMEYKYVFLGQEGSRKEEVGVAAAVLKSDTHIWIGFRGTATEAGEDNILRMYRNWILEKMEAQIQSSWRNAGFDVTAGLLEQKKSDVVPRSMMLFGSGLVEPAAGAKLFAALQETDASADLNRMVEEGYWTLTQAIVRFVLPFGRADDEGREVILAGHSQGGMRAAFASMWLKKVDGKAYKTYSLAGVGTQCVGQQFYAQYFDSATQHDQIRHYVHPLDSLGWMDYQNGKQCMYGTTDLDSNIFLQAEFGKLVGQSGPSIFLDAR